MRILLDLLYLLAAAAYSPVAIYRFIAQNRYRTGWAQRFGKIARKHPEKECIWLHAVSVGEVNATRTIVSELESRFGDFEILISTTTDTGFAQAKKIFADGHTVVYFPLDISWIMRRAFSNIRPSICLLMELEVWPNHVRIANELNVPVVVVNGRISGKSVSVYKKIKPIARRIFERLSLILAQTEHYAKCFVEIGCPEEKVVVTGSLKYDTAEIADAIEGADEIAAELTIEGEKLLVAGGTGNDEERILLEVYRKLQQQEEFSRLRLVIVPRKPERFNEVAQQIKQAGFALIRYSAVKNKMNAPKTDSQTVILGDTMGDLRKFYSLATVIFVGRSLVPMGGSDMMEAAALAKPTIFGPYAFNFRQTVEALLQGDGAIMVNDKKQLQQAVEKCIREPDYAQTIARNGQNIIRKNQGATKRTIEQIAKPLNASR